VTVVVTIQHPGHVHFFRHAIAELEAAGEDVHVFVRRKPPAVELLRYYGIEHTVLAEESDSVLTLPLTQFGYEYRLFRAARVLDPDLFLAVGGVAASHVARLCGADSVVFTDTEHASLINRLAIPYATSVYTPSCYDGRRGEDHVSYPGYHELAYLHPNRFEPASSGTVRTALDVDEDDDLVVLRLSDWNASHDVGANGLSDVSAAVEALEAAGGTVRITAERSLDDDLEPYRVSVPPHLIHDVLAEADLFVGEGATMAAESAVLGTPAVYINSLELGYVTELADRYGLAYTFHGPRRHERGIETATALLADLDDRWAGRREALLADKVDTTDVVMGAADRYLSRAVAPEVVA
jgi:predicted glycosyltransferase